MVTLLRPRSCAGRLVSRRLCAAGVDRRSGQRGSALLPVMLLMLLFSAIAIGAAAVVRVEVLVADRFRRSAEARYAAEAALGAALAELRRSPDWAPVTAGIQTSVLSQGAFAGYQSVPAGGTVHLCCEPDSVFGRLEHETRAARSPSRQALVWRPFLWTSFRGLTGSAASERLYLVVFVAAATGREAPAGTDGTGAEGASEGEDDSLVVRAEAVDPAGLRRVVESLVGRRRGEGVVRTLTWRDVR